MEKITSSARFFDVEATLECGQIFRYERADNGFYVHSGDKTCFAYNDGENAVIVTEDGDKDYFYRFFDLDADYGAYYAAAKKEGGILSQAAEAGKGIRILRQNEEETLFSFLVSQNNRIPRIKKILNGLCESSGEKYLFCGKEQRAFPSAKSLAEKELSYFTRAGLGYRDRYVKAAADKIAAGYSLSVRSTLCRSKKNSALLTAWEKRWRIALRSSPFTVSIPFPWIRGFIRFIKKITAEKKRAGARPRIIF